MSSLFGSRIGRGALALLGIGVLVVPLLAASLSGRPAAAAQATPAADEQPNEHRPRLGRIAARCQRQAAFAGTIHHRVDESLATLVDDGVLTEEEAAAVRAVLLGSPEDTAAPDATDEATPAASATEATERGSRGHARPCARLARLGAWIEEVSAIVRIEPDELVVRLAAGESLAEIADREGVSRDALLAGLETAFEERLDRAEERGRITEEERAEIEAEVPERLEELVDRRRGAPAGSDSATTPN